MGQEYPVAKTQNLDGDEHVEWNGEECPVCGVGRGQRCPKCGDEERIHSQPVYGPSIIYWCPKCDEVF